MYYELLAKLKNAQAARRQTLRIPYSNEDFAVAKILAEKKFIKDVRKKTFDKKNVLELDLLTDRLNPPLRGFRIVSKPGRRIYTGYRALKSVRQGYGVGVLSTPSGVLTDKEARKNKVGGEYLFEIW